MKKLFLILAVSAAFVACDNSTDATTTTTDTTMTETPAVVAPVVTDTTMAAPMSDTTKMMDTTTKM